MAARPIKPTISAAIIRDWRTGEYRQRDLADKYKVSTGTVAKLTKGVACDGAPTVNAGAQYKQGLNHYDEQDERMVSAITEAVDQRVKRLDWLRSMAMKNVHDAMKAPCDNQQDFRARAETINKAVDTVDPKTTATTAIQINNDTRPKRTLADFYAEEGQT